MICRFLLVSAVVAFTCQDARAHKLLIALKLEPTQVRLEAFYDDDSPADEATVIVRNEAGEIVVQGKTDLTGVWHFPRPEPGNYTVKVNSVGHVGNQSFVVPEEKKETTITQTRVELTRTPWLAILGGILAIGVLTWLWSRSRGKD